MPKYLYFVFLTLTLTVLTFPAMGTLYLYNMGTNTPKRLRFLVFTVVLGSAPSMGTPWLETKHDRVVICVDTEVRFLWFKYKLYYVLSV